MLTGSSTASASAANTPQIIDLTAQSNADPFVPYRMPEAPPRAASTPRIPPHILCSSPYSVIERIEHAKTFLENSLYLHYLSHREDGGDLVKTRLRLMQMLRPDYMSDDSSSPTSKK